MFDINNTDITDKYINYIIEVNPVQGESRVDVLHINKQPKKAMTKIAKLM